MPKFSNWIFPRIILHQPTVGMETQLFKIRLRTLFVLTAMAAVLASMASISMTALYLASIFCAAIVTNYFLRFRLDQMEIGAGLLTVVAGAGWGAVVMGLYMACTKDAVSAFLGLGVGSLIGFMVSIVATLVFALIPRQGLEYVAPTPQTELSGAGFEPFKDTQGF